MEKWEALCTVDSDVKWYSQYENCTDASQNVKNTTTI